jgi:DNA (cytosine-5)-methyltransferase 1
MNREIKLFLSEMEFNIEHNSILSKFKFIDLFCGIGGFHQAFDLLSNSQGSTCHFECVFACDIDNECRETYKKNYGIQPESDITKINIKDIPSFDILCAGFPCQPFSKAGNQKGFVDENRGNLFFNICDIVKHHQPSYMILENVKNLEKHDQGNTWKTIRQNIDNLGYHTYERPLSLNSLMFGVPQNRERVIIVCKRKDLGVLSSFPKIKVTSEMKEKTSLLTIVRDDESEENRKFTIDKKLKVVETVWNRFIQILIENKIQMPKFALWTDWWDGDGKDTTTTKHDPKLSKEENEKMVNKNIENFLKKYDKLIDKNRKFWIEHKNILSPWLMESRTLSEWKGAVRKFEWQANDLRDNDSMFRVLWTPRSSGIRVKRLNYSPTLVAMTNIPIYGPESRHLSPRELLRLQSFSESFIPHEKKNVSYKQTGNSVNVLMIKSSIEFLLFNKDITS